MRRYAIKVEVLGTSGQHVRWVPALMAEALVNAEHAAIQNANGKVKSVRLIETAETLTARIGSPTQPTCPPSVRFVRRVQTEAGTFWEHHPRATDYD